MRALFIPSASVILVLAHAGQPGPVASIHFSQRSVPFVLESSESATHRYAPETMAGGVAVFDFNNDGHPDIFFANGAELPSLTKSASKYRNRLFRNDGRDRFTDVTEQAGLAGKGFDNGVAVGDYDNDGWRDLFIAGVHHNTLYRNNGNGTFTDATAAAGLSASAQDEEFGPLWSIGGAWLDYDNDGWLDLFIVNYVRWSADKEPECQQGGQRDYCHPKYYGGTPNRLYRNDGKGGFADVSGAAGIRPHIGKGMGAAVADFDADGSPDVFVPNDKGANFLFRNSKNGVFSEVALQAGVAWLDNGVDISGMGADFRDWNNDGLPDVFFVALDGETFPLFGNSGNGLFRDLTTSTGLAALTRKMGGFGPAIWDFDNDGWKDMFAARGHVQALDPNGTVAIRQHNTVFRNSGREGKFVALTDAAGLTAAPPQRHRGIGLGDFNGDGRTDLIVTALGASSELWTNDTAQSGHWLDVKLQGTRSNRDGIGATIKLVTLQGAQFNHMTTAVGYGSASAGPVHFGTGADKIASLVEIRWPSGITQQLKDVPCDRVLTVIEPRR